METLKTEIWVAALIRRAETAGAFAAVAAKGDPTAGAVVVKVNVLNGRARLAVPAIDGEGARAWINPLANEADAEGTVPEPEADAYAARRRARDPDLWVVEVEDRAGRDFIV